MTNTILLIATVVLLVATLSMIYSGRLDDGTLVSRGQCISDREYYYQYEKKCDLFEFYGPVFLGPPWVILLLAWIGVGKRPRFKLFSS